MAAPTSSTSWLAMSPGPEFWDLVAKYLALGRKVATLHLGSVIEVTPEMLEMRTLPDGKA